MDVVVYFPILAGASQGGELRQVNARHGDSAARLAIHQAPGSDAERREMEQAVAALDVWEGARDGPGRAPGGVLLGVQSRSASVEDSSRLAVAAADWAARRGGAPAALLVATGSLPDAQEASATGRLKVLPVGGVAEKAAIVAASLAPHGILQRATAPGGSFAGMQVLFACPAAAMRDPANAAALAALERAGARPLPVETFEDLLAVWYPEAWRPETGRTAPPGRAASLPAPTIPRRRRAVSRAVPAVLLAATCAAALMLLAPTTLDAAVARLVVTGPVRHALKVVAADADAGCALLAATGISASGASGYGWGAVRQGLAGCAALGACDADAGSVFDAGRLARGSRGGLPLTVLTADRARLGAARAACAEATSAFPGLARVPYQLGRVLGAGGEAPLRVPAREARARAAALGHPLAIGEAMQAEAIRSPEGLPEARRRLLEMAARPGADPGLLMLGAELLACGLHRPAALRGAALDPADLDAAVTLVAAAEAAPDAAALPPIARQGLAALRARAVALRGAREPLPPRDCGDLLRMAAG